MKHLSPVAKPVTLSKLRVESLKHGVFRIVLSRSEVRNAFDEDLRSQLLESLLKLKSEETLRLLVLQGEGHMFCAGADLDYMKRQAQQGFDDNFKDAEALGDLFWTLATFPAPVLSAVRGAAIGGGFGLVCCSDFCVADAGSFFATTEVRLGLVPGVIGPYVARKLGLAWAQRMSLSGARFSCEQLEMSGIITRRVLEGEAFDDVLENEIVRLLQASPLAARRCKQLLIDCVPLPTSETRRAAAQHIASARAEKDGKEGLGAFFEKRTPQWQEDLPKERQ